MGEGIYVTPNWNAGLTETREFLTEIFTSRSGKEQRRAKRKRPRTTISYTGLLDKHDFRRLERSKMAGGEQKIGNFVYPAVTLRLPAVAGATEIHVNSVPETDFCIHSGRAIEFCQLVGAFPVVGFDGGFDDGFGPPGYRLVLNAPLTRSWSAGASLRPVLEGRVGAETTVGMVTSGLGTAKVSFDVLPGGDVQVPAVYTFPTLLNGIEVFLRRPNWSTAPSVTLVTPYEEVDYGVGVTTTYTPIGFSHRQTVFSYTDMTYIDVMRAVSLFNRCFGMAGEFYCPTWTADLDLAVSASSGATALYVSGEEVAFTYTGDTVRKAVLVVKKDGTTLPLGLSSIASAGTPGQSRLNLSAALGTALSPSDIDMICWLPICRFASDTLTVEWVTDTAAKFVLNIKALEKL